MYEETPMKPVKITPSKWDEINGNLKKSELPTLSMDELYIPDVITLTARLAQILSEESELLEEMMVDGLSELQREKNLLIDALTAVRHQITTHPDLLAECDEEDLQNLQDVVAVFNEILEENYQQLLMARKANIRLVNTMSQVVNREYNNDIYDEKGKADKPVVNPLSVSLNKKI